MLIMMRERKRLFYKKALGFALGSFWFLKRMASHTPRIWERGKEEVEGFSVIGLLSKGKPPKLHFSVYGDSNIYIYITVKSV